MDDYEIDFEQKCPKCGNEHSYYHNCDSLNCDDGMSDEHFNDAINSPIEGMDLYKCSECNGKGIIEWCPKCGYDY